MLLFSSFTLPCFVAGFLVGLGCTLLFDLIAGRVGAKSAGADSGRTGERFSDVSEVHATSDFKSGLRMTPWMISLFFVFLWELLKANWAVLVTAFRPKLGIEPGIIALPIDLDSDLKIMLLANMITLTPGTISVEISNDNRFIYVHALDCSDPQGVIDGIDKAFTRRLKGVKWHDFNVS
jgi:multisubunit Na+/H+ antiporter MnhE subunit